MNVAYCVHTCAHTYIHVYILHRYPREINHACHGASGMQALRPALCTLEAKTPTRSLDGHQHYERQSASYWNLPFRVHNIIIATTTATTTTRTTTIAAAVAELLDRDSHYCTTCSYSRSREIMWELSATTSDHALRIIGGRRRCCIIRKWAGGATQCYLRRSCARW